LGRQDHAGNGALPMRGFADELRRLVRQVGWDDLKGA
jgi:hypothetical protein